MVLSNKFWLLTVASVAATVAAVTPATRDRAKAQPGPQGDVAFVQTSGWSDDDRQQFYQQDQGSTLMPLAWAAALKNKDGAPFFGDSLTRYGYLANPSNADGLPVGFTTTTFKNARYVGMTCAACHTREIDVGGARYRIDGGPAIVDFQALLTDLVASAGRAASDEEFPAFADAVLGSGATQQQRAKLRSELALWLKREGTLAERAYSRPDIWGLGRLDAVSMIYNRVTGLDIGPGPDRIIAGNIAMADAPVRYPFIWNATLQDKTQWPGFAGNGDNLLGLARNTGEVYGVFANFHPVKVPLTSFRNYQWENSANFPGLGKLENIVSRIPAPKWPWAIDADLAERGRRIFFNPSPDINCAGCHDVRNGTPRFDNGNTWKTPVQDVGTDSRQYTILHRDVDTGVLAGGRILLAKPLKARDDTLNVLTVAVANSLLQGGVWQARSEVFKRHQPQKDPRALFPALKAAFGEAQSPDDKDWCNETRPYCYEARVLHGIWAAAPYLHNGSVPTLDDLLRPAALRPATFAVGREYDTQKVGLAQIQIGSTATRVTTGAEDRSSGNSRAGHEFGTQLSDFDRKALLEYLKTL